MQGQSLGQEDPLEEAMATHSSILPMDRGTWPATVHRVSKSQASSRGSEPQREALHHEANP